MVNPRLKYIGLACHYSGQGFLLKKALGGNDENR